ncbi:MAG: hypothetical protein Solivirus1_34 [Solivirus sp.]|uniref:F-box domain-containing protein n=1 Tax=Solivirus sp. TaxID=2487772 RepID=A0A3G5AFC3_9VIRU|nr:MAG: hypothetical protein Solivirus1_34 [Solivirus sp.]
MIKDNFSLLKEIEMTERNEWTGHDLTDKEIMMRLDDKSLFNFCKTNRTASKLCNTELFWRQRLLVMYPDISEKPDRLTYKDYYSIIAALKSDINRVSDAAKLIFSIVAKLPSEEDQVRVYGQLELIIGDEEFGDRIENYSRLSAYLLRLNAAAGNLKVCLEWPDTDPEYFIAFVPLNRVGELAEALQKRYNQALKEEIDALQLSMSTDQEDQSDQYSERIEFRIEAIKENAKFRIRHIKPENIILGTEEFEIFSDGTYIEFLKVIEYNEINMIYQMLLSRHYKVVEFIVERLDRNIMEIMYEVIHLSKTTGGGFVPLSNGTENQRINFFNYLCEYLVESKRDFSFSLLLNLVRSRNKYCEEGLLILARAGIFPSRSAFGQLDIKQKGLFRELLLRFRKFDYFFDGPFIQ